MLRRDRNFRHRPSRRSGKNLIELIAVISIMAVVMAAGLRLMHLLFRAERTGTRKAAETVSLALLGREFRRDVHAATWAEFLPDPEGNDRALQLTQPDERQILYTPGEHSLVRRLLRGGAVGRNSIPSDRLDSQQRFRLPDRTIRFELDANEFAVTLVCEPAAAAATTSASAVPRLPVRMVAVIRRDHRFAGREK